MLGTTDLSVPNGAGTSPVGKCSVVSLLQSCGFSFSVIRKQFFILTLWKKWLWKNKGHNFFWCTVTVKFYKLLPGI